MSEVTSKLLASCIVDGIKKAGELAGPVYVKLASQHSAGFFARRIGETASTNGTIDEALEYASKNMKKYLNGYCSFAYGTLKAESTLQGATGSLSRMVAKTATSKAFEKTGFNKALGGASGTSEALRKYYSMLVKLGSMKQEDLRILAESSESLQIEVRNCPYADACNALFQEGVPKILGGHECIRILSFATIIEDMTKKQHDYKTSEMSPSSKCSGTIFSV